MSNWNRSDNFFEPAVNKSYFGAKSIFDAFDLNLKTGGVTDPEILGFYNDFHPFCVAYDNIYGTWSSLRSTRMGKTLGVVQLVDLLSSVKAKNWDVAVQNIYPNTSTEYKTLFPHHRSDFQNGSIDSRLQAVNNLLLAIGADASLAAVKTDATSFALSLKNAIEGQHSQINTINNTLQQLDAARSAASGEAWGTYGQFVTKFKHSPKQMDVYFPVNLLQSVSQSSYTATLAGNKIKKLFRRKLDTTKQTLKYFSVGTEVVHAYFTNGLTNTPAAGTQVFAIQPNTMGECNPTEMGYTDVNRYLHIVNTGTETMEIEIDIMVAG